MKKEIKIRVAVVIRVDDEILMVRHEKHDRTYWLLPGGGLEYSETIKECAAREVLEETGLQVEIGDLIYLSESIPPDEHRHVVNIVLEGKMIGGEISVGEDYVLAEAKFVPISELPNLKIYPPNTDALMAYLKTGCKPAQAILDSIWED